MLSFWKSDIKNIITGQNKRLVKCLLQNYGPKFPYPIALLSLCISNVSWIKEWTILIDSIQKDIRESEKLWFPYSMVVVRSNRQGFIKALRASKLNPSITIWVLSPLFSHPQLMFGNWSTKPFDKNSFLIVFHVSKSIYIYIYIYILSYYSFIQIQNCFLLSFFLFYVKYKQKVKTRPLLGIVKYPFSNM